MVITIFLKTITKRQEIVKTYMLHLLVLKQLLPQNTICQTQTEFEKSPQRK